MITNQSMRTGKCNTIQVAILLASVALGGCVTLTEDEPNSMSDQAVIGGTIDFGDPSIVGISIHQPGSSMGSFCSGTVIGPHTVLTAAHCVSPSTIGDGNVFEVVFGTTLSNPTQRIIASSTTFHPAFDVQNLERGHDIGIVHTSGVLPVPTLRIAPVAVALPVRLVGYGMSSHINIGDTGVGTKRQATAAITWWSTALIQDGSSDVQTCHGDSGGPALQRLGGLDVVVGVTSFGHDPLPTLVVCFDGGFHSRVDADLSFIAANTN